MTRISSDVWIVIALLVFMIGSAYFILRGSAAQEEEMVPVHSSNNSRGSGVRALYLTLHQLGYRVRQHRAPLTELQTPGVLFIMGPSKLSPSGEEWEAFLKWVESGGAALLASDGRDMGMGLPIGYRARGPGSISFPTASQAEPCQLSPLTEGIRTFHVKSASRIIGNEWTPGGGSAGASPSPRAKLAKARSIRARSVSKGTRPATISVRPIMPLLKGPSGIVAAVTTWGKGFVVLLSSPASLSNEAIARPGGFELALNLLRTFNPDRALPVLFDEYHHGFGFERTLWSLFSEPVRLAIGQLGVAFVLLLFLLSRRFGRPIPLPGEGKRARSEYLTSMALLFKRARALEAVRLTLGSEFIRRITSVLALPLDATMDQIILGAQDRKGIEPERLRQALARCGPGAGHSFIGEKELLQFAGELHALRRECER